MMQRLFGIILFVCLILCSGNVIAVIQLDNALANDIGKAYGYYLSQEYSLNKISEKYPSLSDRASVAKIEFAANFKSSIEGIDALMAKHFGREWEKIKEMISLKITSLINIDQITESESREFINLVRERAKGNIESPILETFLLFRAGYGEHPEREFLDGYRYKYSNKGVGKSKGVAFSMELPKTWIAREGNRPNVIQKFVSENGRGLEIFLILINELPITMSKKVTRKDVDELLQRISKKACTFVMDA